MNYYEDEKIENLRLNNEIVEDTEYIDCEFYNCHFIDVEFNNCVFKECKFQNCTINSATFKFTTMRNSTLIESDFIGINWRDLTGDRLSIGPIGKVKESFFKYNNFLGMKLNKMNFSNSRFQESSFEECSITEGDFTNVSFQNTQFNNCNLTKGDFTDAYGYVIDISSNKLKGAKFSFPEVVNLLNSLEINIV